MRSTTHRLVNTSCSTAWSGSPSCAIPTSRSSSVYPEVVLTGRASNVGPDIGATTTRRLLSLPHPARGSRTCPTIRRAPRWCRARVRPTEREIAAQPLNLTHFRVDPPDRRCGTRARFVVPAVTLIARASATPAAAKSPPVRSGWRAHIAAGAFARSRDGSSPDVGLRRCASQFEPFRAACRCATDGRSRSRAR